uniref:C2H2-type domain-containing protein n=1 Tax=Salvator merianae TaxID=96440 RepID=A0A8D0BJ87_SALMN
MKASTLAATPYACVEPPSDVTLPVASMRRMIPKLPLRPACRRACVHLPWAALLVPCPCAEPAASSRSVRPKAHAQAKELVGESPPTCSVCACAARVLPPAPPRHKLPPSPAPKEANGDQDTDGADGPYHCTECPGEFGLVSELHEHYMLHARGEL